MLGTYIERARGQRTVGLVDDDRIRHVVHPYALEGHVGGDAAVGGVGPRLDPNAIGRPSHVAVLHRDSAHVAFVPISSQTSHATIEGKMWERKVS